VRKLSFLIPLLASTSLMAVAAPETEDKYPMDFQPEPVFRQLEKVEGGIKAGPYQADWSSLQAFQVPEWFRDAKFGIFIHWGVYSVPAYANEWYSRNMYSPGNKAYEHHRKTYGPQSEFGYKDFIPMFTAENYDPGEWVEAFQAAGARYLVFVAEHCDGFPMYDSDMTDWDAVQMGPKRDTAGELMVAARQAGMHFGLSSHRAEHWWWNAVGRTYDSDVNDPRFAGLYGPAAPRTLPGNPAGSAPWSNHLENWLPPNKQFLDDWLARTTEIVDKYQPEMLYLDWWTGAPAFEPELRKLAAYYYNSGARDGYSPAISYKGEQFRDGAALFDIERGKLDALRLEPWQTDTSVSIRSWGYIEDDEFRTSKSLVQHLIDVVAKNGNLLLNVGPKADGTLPDEALAVLNGIGAWLDLNGEAIYNSRPWKYFGEGPTTVESGEKSEDTSKVWTTNDFRFTVNTGNLYAMGMEWPSDGKAAIKTLYRGSPYLESEIEAVDVLGFDGSPQWELTDQGLQVQLPSGSQLDSGMPYTLRISFKK